MRVLIIGCGYAGKKLGARLASGGHEVIGLRRSADADSELKTLGITPLHADITKPDDLTRLPGTFDCAINLVSSSGGGVEDYRAVYLEGARHLIAALRGIRSFIYTSSTSVYGQTDGSLVEETSPAEPESVTSRILVETENAFLHAFRTTGFPAMVLRVAGIYGPGRGHLFKQFVRGEATLRDDGHSFINMIHVDDLAAALEHLLQHGRAGEIYNIADDEPVTQRDFFAWLARRLGRPMPPSAAADPRRKRGLTSKRVSNAKLRSTGFHLHYPSWREGYEPEIRALLNSR